MPVLLDNTKLRSALGAIARDPKDAEAIAAFLKLLGPIIRLTQERFPVRMADDIKQEVHIHIMERVGYLAKAYFDGKIENPTNYMFRVCYNAACGWAKKEGKHDVHLVSINDVKIDPAITPRTYRRMHVIEEIRTKIQGYIRARFAKPKDRIIAERFLDKLIGGKRPSFDTTHVERFSNAGQEPAKDVYSIILDKVRVLLSKHIAELSE